MSLAEAQSLDRYRSPSGTFSPGERSLSRPPRQPGRTAFAPRASAVVAATIDRRFGIKGRAHGQIGTVRGSRITAIKAG